VTATLFNMTDHQGCHEAVMTSPIAGQVKAWPARRRFGRPFGISLRRLGVAAFIVAGSSLVSNCAVFQKVDGWFTHDAKPPQVAEHPVAPAPTIVQTPRPKPPVPAQVREAPPPKPEKPEKLERLASVDPNSLIGMEPSTVEKLLGSPSRITKNNISLVWIYSGAGCAFQIFFYPDVKTSAFHALKYGGTDGSGGSLVTSQPCIRDILVAKTNAPG
jgi:hypothetical protein